jgi:hypothetical protein
VTVVSLPLIYGIRAGAPASVGRAHPRATT